MSRHLARVDEIQQNYRIQRGELFKENLIKHIPIFERPIYSLNSTNF